MLKDIYILNGVYTLMPKKYTLKYQTRFKAFFNV